MILIDELQADISLLIQCYASELFVEPTVHAKGKLQVDYSIKCES